MVGRAQLASAPDCGSGGRGFESLYPPLDGKVQGRSYTRPVRYLAASCLWFITRENNGLSPSGKAQDFDSCIRWFESS